MRIAVQIARVIVGLLFIFSGLIKANDPLGLSYKMQEFFDLWGMSKFNSWTLTMSVLMNAFEIIAGFALLIGWRIRIFSWLLLLLIVFFTFLTGYAYFSGQFKNCGCFGDCLPITPGTSFMKDIILLLLITFIFFNQRYIRPVLGPAASATTMLGIALLSFAIQWYMLRNLPFVDCLPFKKGKNISEQMKIPAGARPDSFAIMFVYEKGGKQFEFSPAELPSDLGTYKFISRKDKLIRKGNAEPPIKGFNLKGESGTDSTEAILSLPKSILLFCEDFKKPVTGWASSFKKIYDLAHTKNIPVFVITTQPGKAKQEFNAAGFGDLPVLTLDYTAVRTAARANPTVYLLQQGTIAGKWSRVNFGKAITLLQGW